MSADVIIIGAGYGGLTAAAILAHNGLVVELHEMTGHLGGRATFDRKDNFLVDYGIHTHRFAGEGAAAAALKLIGHEIDFVTMGHPQVYTNGSFSDLPTTPFKFLRADFLSLSSKLLSVIDLAKLVTLNPGHKADVPLRNILVGGRNANLEQFFETLSGTCIISPDLDETSAGALSEFLKKALRAKEHAGFPKLGTCQVITALEQKIEESGTIIKNSRVKSLSFSRGKITGVGVKEDISAARAVVLAVPKNRTAELLHGIVPDEYLESFSSIIPTAGISIDLCLNRKVSDINGVIITDTPFTLGQFTSNIDPDTAPEGKQLVTWLYPLPVDTMANKKRIETEEAKLRTLIDEMFEGIMDYIEWERVLHLQTVDGFKPGPGQTAKDRPGVANPHIPNLFHAGDIISAPGVSGDVAFTSGVEAAAKVMEYLK